MRLFLASFVSVGLLFAFLLLPVHLALLNFGVPGIYSILVSLLLLVLAWWFSTKSYDYFFTQSYGVKWIALKDLQERHYAFSVFLQELLLKQDLKLGKFGLIEDDRPIGIAYGSGKNDLRLIFTSGMFAHLNEQEQQAFAAHEVGHLLSQDLPMLSAAYLPAFLLYQPAKSFWRGEKASRFLAPLGVLLYLLHWLYSLPVLMHGRVREYSADEFACANSHPNALGTALAKTAFAYISSGGRRKSDNLMEAARPFAMLDFKLSRHLALAYLNQKETGSWILLENMILQDIYNPWSALFEAGSTHPLAGRRLLRISSHAQGAGAAPFIDLQRMFAEEVARTMLRIHFLEDFTIYVIARASPALIILLLIAGYFYNQSAAIGIFVLLYGLGIALLSLYSFSYINFQNEALKSQLLDAFVSPIRGRPLMLEGVIREKSSLGLDLPEELIFADHSGEIFIGPRSLVPLVLSPYISAEKLMRFKDERVKVKGWYMRAEYPKIIIDEVQAKEQRINGRQRLFDLGLACLLCSAGVLIFMFS